MFTQSRKQDRYQNIKATRTTKSKIYLTGAIKKRSRDHLPEGPPAETSPSWPRDLSKPWSTCPPCLHRSTQASHTSKKRTNEATRTPFDRLVMVMGERATTHS